MFTLTLNSNTSMLTTLGFSEQIIKDFSSLMFEQEDEDTELVRGFKTFI
jgi:hypothetical protein